MTKVFVTLSLLTLWWLSGCQRSEPQPVVFDVPSLIGKNIREVEAAIGPSTETNEKSLATTSQGLHDGIKRWDRPVVSLVVHYALATGQVKHFLLDTGGKSPAGELDNEEEALAVGNLKRDEGNYFVDFIPLKQGGQIWMVRITPRS